VCRFLALSHNHRGVRLSGQTSPLVSFALTARSALTKKGAQLPSAAFVNSTEPSSRRATATIAGIDVFPRTSSPTTSKLRSP
jgi:hypothetical protein